MRIGGNLELILLILCLNGCFGTYPQLKTVIMMQETISFLTLYNLLNYKWLLEKTINDMQCIGVTSIYINAACFFLRICTYS